jgi:UDP-4-amino-4,6-dideoxy-N-acetyl-beta-L-altrosamine transaminase
MIPYGRQSISQSDIDAVAEVLRSDWLTQGAVVPRFEKVIADHCGAEHAVAMNSATSALHIACLALGVGPGDLVWTSPISFVASSNCARYCGADVDFVDVDAETANLSPVALERKLEAARRDGRLPKVVIPVHLTGQSCDMEAIHVLSRRYGFRIIEDASHAIGGSYRGEPVGNCRYSDATVFSFHPVKVITSGEGGMVTTNDAELAGLMERLRSHGITREPALLTREPDGPWYYEQLELGFNYRLTDIHAALGLSQMSRLEEFVRRRNEIAARYDEALAGLPLRPLGRQEGVYSAYHLYVIRLDLARLSRSHRDIFVALRERGIGVNLHYMPIYRQPDYARFGFNAQDFPEAERYYSEAISVPLYPDLSQDMQDQVVTALREVLAP